MDLGTRRIESGDFKWVFEFCYQGVRSAKPESKALAEFNTLLSSGRLISTVQFDESKGTGHVVSLIIGAFLSEGQIDKLRIRRAPDLTAHFAKQIKLGHFTKRSPFADSQRVGYNNARHGNDLIVLYLGFSDQVTDDERREIERKTFQRFVHDWSGFKISTVSAEVWSANQNTAAEQLLLTPFNEYRKWHRRYKRASGSMPQLRGADRQTAKQLSSANVLADLFGYEPPIYDLQPAVKELLRFALKIPPYRSELSKTRLNRVLSEHVYPEVRERGPLANKLLHKSEDAQRSLVLEYFKDHPWELRPFGNERTPIERRPRGLSRFRKDSPKKDDELLCTLE